MKNYIFDLYTVSEFKRDNPALAEKAEQALQYLKGYYPNGSEFVVIGRLQLRRLSARRVLPL